MTASPHRRRTGRLVLIGLAALFFVPLVLATVWYIWFPEYAPSGQPNGRLIDPPQALEPFRLARIDADQSLTLGDLRGGWHMVQFVDGPCDQACRQRVHILRQVNVALGKDRDRVSRWLITPQDRSAAGVRKLLADYPRLHILQADGGLGEQFPSDRSVTSVFLTDPQGNLMMRYGPDTGGDPILDDLEHLLKVSRPADAAS